MTGPRGVRAEHLLSFMLVPQGGASSHPAQTSARAKQRCPALDAGVRLTEDLDLGPGAGRVQRAEDQAAWLQLPPVQQAPS